MSSDTTNRSLAVVPDAVIEPVDLTDLAATANKEHDLARQSGENMVVHAIRAGEALSAAKENVEHGEWLPWVKANFEASLRTAQVYMAVSVNTQTSAYLEEPSLVKALVAISDSKPEPHVSQNTGENEWYTPPEIVDAAREVMGGIDFDPASSTAANKVVGATDFYTKENSGLDVTWEGRVWLNPPYVSDLVARFTEKLCAEYLADNISEAVLLVNNATETAWFQHTAAVANAVCFHAGRISYWHPDRTSKTPLQGQAILYFGANTDKFNLVFRKLGVVFP